MSSNENQTTRTKSTWQRRTRRTGDSLPSQSYFVFAFAVVSYELTQHQLYSDWTKIETYYDDNKEDEEEAVVGRLKKETTEWVNLCRVVSSKCTQ